MGDRVGQQLGHYHLQRLLGRGAFAEVYLAQHRYLEVPAAIKVLHVSMDQEAQQQFQREARTLARLQHPHIVRVFDFGIEDQTAVRVFFGEIEAQGHLPVTLSSPPAPQEVEVV